MPFRTGAQICAYLQTLATATKYDVPSFKPFETLLLVAIVAIDFQLIAIRAIHSFSVV